MECSQDPDFKGDVQRAYIFPNYDVITDFLVCFSKFLILIASLNKGQIEGNMYWSLIL